LDGRLFDDGTITVRVAAPVSQMGGAPVLTVALAEAMPPARSGQYWLARCGVEALAERDEDWGIYLRRPLWTVAERPATTDDERRLLLLPALPPDDAGSGWLLRRPANSAINLIGPLGNGFEVDPSVHRLLLMTTPALAPALFAVANRHLDRSGAVSWLLLDNEQSAVEALLPWLPRAAEVHRATSLADPVIAEAIRWADGLCSTLEPAGWQPLAEIVRANRLRLDPGYAQLLVQADLVCGTGACLACVVPSAGGGMTRACIHGPVFDLKELAR
jgi:dihydroorotate dehydrogenase electron transfer subunit